MAKDIDWAALGNLISTATLANAPVGSPAARYAEEMNERFRGQQIQAAQKKAEKERKKKEKSGLLSKLGSAAGTAAGLALAPATGGASLAIPALTGAAGGAIGSAAGGGGFDPYAVAAGGAQGLMGGFLGSAYNPALAGAATEGAPGELDYIGGGISPSVAPQNTSMRIPYGQRLSAAFGGAGGLAGAMGGAMLPQQRRRPVYDPDDPTRQVGWEY